MSSGDTDLHVSTINDLPAGKPGNGVVTPPPPIFCEPMTTTATATTTPPVTPETAENSNPFAGQFLTLDELFARQYRTDWIIQGMIGAQEIGVIFGDPGVGKSFLVLNVLASLAMGLPTWAAGHFNTPRPRRVLYCTGEGEQGIQKRLYAINEEFRNQHGRGIPSDMLIYLPVIPQLFQFALPENVIAFGDEVLKVAEDKPFDLIVIDTLSQATIGAKEQDNSDMAKVLYITRALQQRLKAAVLYVHHAGKNHLYRGASAILGNVNFMVEVRREGIGQGVLHCEKVKDGKPFADVSYQLRHVESPFDEEGTAVIDWYQPKDTMPVWRRVAEHIDTNPDRRHTVKTLAEETCIPQDQVKNAVRDRIDHMVARYHRELQNPLNKASNRNPMTYRIKDEHISDVIRDNVRDTSGI